MSKITILTPEQLAERDRRAHQQPSKPARQPVSSVPLRPIKRTDESMTRPASALAPSLFASHYPNIALFVADFGVIEVGHDDGPLGFIRAIDEGGVVWDGEAAYPSIDAAFDDLEQGIGAWLDEELPEGDAS